MKKLFVLLLISLFFITGCNIKEINANDLNKLTDNILSKKLGLYNRVSSGYKYYAPRGIRVIDSTDYNEKLFSDGVKYYLYVDVVSYFFKKELKYEVNEEAYFSKKLDYKGKKGYLEITKNKNIYFIEMMFNYSKIEAYVSQSDINKTVLNASYILNSLVFNDSLISLAFDENKSSFNEEDFKIFEPKRQEGNFIDYINEYNQYEGTIDEELLNQDQTEIPGETLEDTLNEGGNYETD